MQAREAVAAAKKYLDEMFSEEKISNLGLEELEFDDTTRVWNITLGFSRPWDLPQNALLAMSRDPSQWRRNYKVVRIADLTGKLLSIKNREPIDAG